MNQKLNGWADTIVALATPPGIGALGIIRMSGKNACGIANKLFKSVDLAKQASPSLHVGYLSKDGKILDEVVVSVFKSPKSYTGEDVIEFSCHGSPFILQQVMDACIALGARMAKAGEFTQRAFLNGKLDLAQAEAVADLIASNTSVSQKAALHTIRGGFSQTLKNLRERLIQFSALIELELDFSQEDVEFADRSQLYKLIDELTTETSNLIGSFRLGNAVRNGISVAIVGRPNAGKSTLLNTLLNENRAIVSDIPGTTRDTIEEILNIDGILFRLIDTAGIREHTHDILESAGMERSIRKMQQADLVIYLLDASVNPEAVGNIKKELDENGVEYLLIVNKIDEAGEELAKEKFRAIEGIIYISAKRNKHIELLKERMTDVVLKGDVQTEAAIVTNARHYHALKQVEKSLFDIKAGLDKRLTGDLLALDIRRCLHYLGEITGEITNEDQLEYIFSKFCIGK